MNGQEDKDAAMDTEFGEQLGRLKSVLDAERQALLDGDAKTVTSLAIEKERIADSLSAMRKSLPDESATSVELKKLAGQVEELAQLNHILLRDMYQFYHGMLELFMRIGGRGQTYGKNGYLNLDANLKRETGILA